MSHPRGSQNVRALLRGLEQADLLDGYYTTLGWRGEAGRRAYEHVPKGGLHASPWRELMRLVLHRFGGGSVTQVDCMFDRDVAQAIDRGASSARGVFCYENSALETFRAAARRGLTRIYELPAPYWRAVRDICAEEAEREPEWREALPALWDSSDKLARKEDELAAADRIVVPSEFARRSLGTISGHVDVVPYGAPPVANSPAAAGQDLRVLFVGNMNQQKGLSYLLDAMARVGPRTTLTLLGARPAVSCAPLDQALRQHCWLRPRSHAAVLDVMAQHDVLVFPTLCDGFGLVIAEALSRGLPVIATPNCAAPEILTDGVDGFIVPIRDAEAIAAWLDLLASDRERLRAMREAARRKAAALAWSGYERRIVGLARTLMSDSLAA